MAQTRQRQRPGELQSFGKGGTIMSDASRQQILQQLRRRLPTARSLPETLDGDWIRYPDLVEQLGRMVTSVGGSFEQLPTVQDVWRRLQDFPEVQSAQRVVSLVDGIPGNVDLAKTEDPHLLEDVDFLISSGEIAVAENGAVWVTDQQPKHRVVYFINQYLVFVIPRSRIVATMHDAYRILLGRPLPGFGCFVSGPSKTADIEQSLVIGAHGCRSLQMYVIDG
jgi:L-lactate dehydrogenase complex protein LldG